jgi:tRNA (cytidine/uridine-2'-O-)-methyltransferase
MTDPLVADGGEPPFHIVLVEPLIPPNTGSVGRMCVGTGCRLHLVEPLGFRIDEKSLRRAGLDYWKHVDLRVHRDWLTCQAALALPPERFHYLSTHASRPYTAVRFQRGDVLVFGKETTGLGHELLAAAPDRGLRVPVFGPVRSYNLANTVSIVLFEALRQIQPVDFPGP